MKVHFSGRFVLAENKFQFRTDVVATTPHMYDKRPVSVSDAGAWLGMFREEELERGVLTDDLKKLVESAVYTMLTKAVELAALETRFGPVRELLGEDVTTDLSLPLAMEVYAANQGAKAPLTFEFIEGPHLTALRKACADVSALTDKEIEDFVLNGDKFPVKFKVGDRVRIVKVLPSSHWAGMGLEGRSGVILDEPKPVSGGVRTAVSLSEPVLNDKGDQVYDPYLRGVVLEKVTGERVTVLDGGESYSGVGLLKTELERRFQSTQSAWHAMCWDAPGYNALKGMQVEVVGREPGFVLVRFDNGVYGLFGKGAVG